MNTNDFNLVVAEMRADTEQELGFDSLEELARESTRTIVASQVKTLDDLDQLLSESIAIRDDADNGALYRKQLAKGGMTKEEKALIEWKLQEWESRREWETVANVALVRFTTCACGADHIHFVGLYYRQVHRTLKTGKRLVAAKQRLNDVVVPAEVATIPNEVLHENRTSTFCPSCLVSKGFNVFQSKEVEWQDEQ
jgi:hypothetical protein